MQYTDVIQKKVGLREGISCIEKIFAFLYLEGEMSTKILAQKVFLPIPIVTAIKKEMINLDLAMQYKGITLTNEGKKYVEDFLGYRGLELEKVKKLKTDLKFQSEMVDYLADKYAEIYETRPDVNVEIDQAKATTTTVFKRALLALSYESIIHKKILCIGDDDFVSVAIGLLLKEIYSSPEDISSEIVVFDIDERIVDYINQISKTLRIPVNAIKMDFQNPMPIYYVDYFDTFFTDPPYTATGMTLFMSRGVSALKKEKGLKIFLSFGQKPVNETLDIQKIINNHGLVILSIMKGFNEYDGAGLLGNLSQMIVIESTDYVRNVIPDGAKYNERIYTADFRKHISMYRCKKCNSVYKLGRGEKITTIEKLKEMGCSSCGNDVFELMKNNKNSNKESNYEMVSLGKHILADFYNCNSTLLGDVDFIRKIMHNATEISKATIVEENFHKFSPWGVSGAIIIQESHLTIHTWPEYGYAAVDVFTCGELLDAWKALDYLKEQLQCKELRCNDIGRGTFETSRINSAKLP